jgi:hypothetical protein
MMDNYLGWLFDFKDLMYDPAPEALTELLLEGFDPIGFPDWLTRILPGDYTDEAEDSLELDLYGLVNQPVTSINSALRSVHDSMDFNHDGTLNNFETIKGTVTFLYKGAKGLSDLWDHVSSVPGLKAALASTGYATVPMAIVEGVKFITPALETTLQSLLVMEQVLEAIDGLDQIGQSYTTASQADLSGLALNLGSHVIDFKTGSIQTLEKGIYSRVEDFISPDSFNPEPGLGYEAAINRLLSAADRNDATDQDDGSGTFIHEHVFKVAGVDGVTSQNVGAMRSLLNAVPIDSGRLKLNRAGETVRTPSQTDPDLLRNDGQEPQFGIQDEVNSYLYLFDIVNGKSFSDDWVNQVMPDAFNYLSDARKYEWFLDTHIQALGIPAADFKPSKETQELYLGNNSMAIFYDILDAQTFRGIDTYDKLQALWDTKTTLEDANQNKFATPKPATPKDGNLTLDDLVRLRAPLLDAADLNPINVSLAQYGAKTDETADKLIDTLTDKVNWYNNHTRTQQTDSQPTQYAFDLIARAALNNTAQRDGLTSSNFFQAGIDGVSKPILPMLLQVQQYPEATKQ